jgi:hypothetical protein
VTAGVVGAAVEDLALAGCRSLRRRAHPAQPGAGLGNVIELTGDGRAVLAQAEAIGVEVTAALVSTLGPSRTGRLRETLSMATRPRAQPRVHRVRELVGELVDPVRRSPT